MKMQNEENQLSQKIAGSLHFKWFYATFLLTFSLNNYLAVAIFGELLNLISKVAIISVKRLKLGIILIDLYIIIWHKVVKVMLYVINLIALCHDNYSFTVVK